MESNAHGRILRVLERHDPLPGGDIRLHLDARVQRIAMKAMAGRRGAVVAIDPATGGVIAMVSSPSYDANLFVNGISSKNYRALQEDPDLPLYNRSLQGQYPRHQPSNRSGRWRFVLRCGDPVDPLRARLVQSA